MFSLFFAGLQQDLKIFLVAPFFCALFRLIFIFIYAPEKSPRGVWGKWYHCFRYGFWWGMDFNAYVLLFSVLLVTLPGAFLPVWYGLGDTLRVVGLTIYLAALYTVFMGKLVFYYHYHDIYNHILWLGEKADKNNLADIFFHQNHGVWVLLSYVPYLWLCTKLEQSLLLLPSASLPLFSALWQEYAFAFLVMLAAVAIFYYCRFGGTFQHAKKPEWDEVPSVVKKDVFFAKATVDDLVALEIVWKHPLQALRQHSDEESLPCIRRVLPSDGAKWQGQGNPLDFFRRRAKGARIEQPRHIFFLIGESYSQAPFDEIYQELHLVDGGKAFRRQSQTFVIDNFLPAGEISQPALTSMLSGVYDAGLELNESEDFWRAGAQTSLPLQLRRLGYRSVFWYGGKLTWGSLQHYLPAVGFDECRDAMEFCPADAPRTWLGIYDHIFLTEAARLIEAEDKSQPVCHVLYTTSNHGQYKLPLVQLGYDVEKVMPEASIAAKQAEMAQRRMGVFWYTDKALSDFVQRMQDRYPDSLFIVVGDHAMGVIPFECGVIERHEPTVREEVCTSFAISHPGLQAEMFAGNNIGGQMNIMPTLMELIAPAGLEYYSLFPSLLESLDHIVTPYHWLDKDVVGRCKDEYHQSLMITGKDLPILPGGNPYKEEIEGWSEITGWLARHPELLQHI